MKFSYLLRFLNPEATLHLNCQSFTGAEVLGYMNNGTWEGGDPTVSLRSHTHSIDIFNRDLPLHRQHWGWIEPAEKE